MRVITGIEKYIPSENDIKIFLAGGITNCHNWQNDVILELTEYNNTEHLVIFNPRRENFPIHDPNASLEQITWEYKMLEQMDILSMYFANGDSDQPISLYELGRNILRMQMRFPTDWEKRIIISCESEYKRKQDVIIQTGLATNEKIPVYCSQVVPICTTEDHAALIKETYDKLLKG